MIRRFDVGKHAVIAVCLTLVSACGQAPLVDYAGQDDVRGRTYRISSEDGVFDRFMTIARLTDRGHFVELVLADKTPGIAVYKSSNSRIIKCPLQKKGTFESYQLFHHRPDGEIEGALLVLNQKDRTICVESIHQPNIPV